MVGKEVAKDGRGGGTPHETEVAIAVQRVVGTGTVDRDGPRTSGTYRGQLIDQESNAVTHYGSLSAAKAVNQNVPTECRD